MPATPTPITPDIYDYVFQVSAREHPILKALREETDKLPSAQMQTLPICGQFLAFLVKSINAKRVLEIGTYTGYSSIAMALALPDDGHMICCDTSIEFTDIAKRYWQQANLAHKIQLKLAPAADTLKQLLDQDMAEQFDFIFIDADKRAYDEYYELSLQLLRKGGIIALDNMLREGRVLHPRSDDKATYAIAALNQKLQHDQRVDLSLVPFGDGFSLIHKR